MERHNPRPTRIELVYTDRQRTDPPQGDTSIPPVRQFFAEMFDPLAILVAQRAGKIAEESHTILELPAHQSQKEKK